MTLSTLVRKYDDERLTELGIDPGKYYAASFSDQRSMLERAYGRPMTVRCNAAVFPSSSEVARDLDRLFGRPSSTVRILRKLVRNAGMAFPSR